MVVRGLALIALVLAVTTAQAQVIAGGGDHSIVIKGDGTLWGWGDGSQGQLGQGPSNNSQWTPVRIGSAANWTKVTTGAHHTLALKSDGTIWAWGNNADSQLSNSAGFNQYSPVQVGTDSNWSAVSTGSNHTVAVKSDGTLWAWGSNSYGQLGDGTTTNRSVPVQIGIATNWMAVAAGGMHTVALRSDGTLWAWGDNTYGQLGDGTQTGRTAPVQIGSGTNWARITVGSGTLALQGDGTLWGWGPNFYGELGDGTTTGKNAPVQIAPGTTWTRVASRFFHTVAIRGDGTLWTWGHNDEGQLGDGTTTDRNSPTQVGSANNWVEAAAGYFHTVARASDETYWAWGRNTGDGTPTPHYNPVQIVALSGTSSFSVNPTSLDFGNQPVGNQSASQSVTLNNNSGATVTINTQVVNAPFWFAGTSCGPGGPVWILDTGTSCQASITFSPTTSGLASGSLQLYSDAPGSPHVVSLSGTGVAVSDTTPPSMPTGLTAFAVGNSQIQVYWTASTDNTGVATYYLFRDGSIRATVTAPTVTFNDTGLAPSTLYSYTAQACDAAGNCSAQSAAASATTQATPDTQAPTVPAGLSIANLAATSLTLNWSASTDNTAVTQYKIYRNGVQIAAPAVVGPEVACIAIYPPVCLPAGSSFAYPDGPLANNTTYNYTVAACDAAGNCSAPSASASATTPPVDGTSYTPILEVGFNLIGNSLNTSLNVASIFGNQSAPVAGVTSNVITIWKWNAVAGRWAFYSPQLTVAGIASFAASKGYDVLSTINPGEGYWVNSIAQMTLPTQFGTAFNWSALSFSALPPGFNLVAHANTVTPNQLNAAISAAPPSPGVIPTENFLSLWAWDAAQAKWYFYSPLLEASGGSLAVKNYADTHFYRHFQDYGKTLGIGVGFWVNVVGGSGPVNYALSVAFGGNGAGSVSRNPNAATYAGGTVVTLTATPSAGSTFSGWSGACTGTAACTITMDSNKSVTANFALAQSVSLTVLMAGTGAGSVTSSPGGINCGATCTASFLAGTTVTLTAASAPGSAFAGWSGACSGETCTVSVSASTTVTATFNVFEVDISLARGTIIVPNKYRGSSWSVGGAPATNFVAVPPGWTVGGAAATNYIAYPPGWTVGGAAATEYIGVPAGWSYNGAPLSHYVAIPPGWAMGGAATTNFVTVPPGWTVDGAPLTNYLALAPGFSLSGAPATNFINLPSGWTLGGASATNYFALKPGWTTGGASGTNYVPLPPGWSGGGAPLTNFVAMAPGWILGGAPATNFVAYPPAGALSIELVFNDPGWLPWFQALKGTLSESDLADVIFYVYFGSGNQGQAPAGLWPPVVSAPPQQEGPEPTITFENYMGQVTYTYSLITPVASCTGSGTTNVGFTTNAALSVPGSFAGSISGPTVVKTCTSASGTSTFTDFIPGSGITGTTNGTVINAVPNPINSSGNYDSGSITGTVSVSGQTVLLQFHAEITRTYPDLPGTVQTFILDGTVPRQSAF